MTPSKVTRTSVELEENDVIEGRVVVGGQEPATRTVNGAEAMAG